MIELITGILATAFLAGGVLLLGSLGEVLSERVGVFNLGLEGLMALGGMTGDHRGVVGRAGDHRVLLRRR